MDGLIRALYKLTKIVASRAAPIAAKNIYVVKISKEQGHSSRQLE